MNDDQNSRELNSSKPAQHEKAEQNSNPGDNYVQSSQSSAHNEELTGWAQKSEMEKTLSAGIWGQPQLRPHERRQFLGEFRERVIIYLTLEQVEEEGTYPEVIRAIEDPRAAKLILNSEVDMEAASEYMQLARQRQLQFTTVSSPRISGEAGLVVVSGEAVEEEHIKIPTRREKLIDRGIPAELVDARGQKICSRCYSLIKKNAPEELKNYRRQTILEQLLHAPCPCNHQ